MKAPSGWTVAPIGALGKVMGGRQLSPHLTKGRLRPYLRVANVLDGYIDCADVKSMLFRDDEFERYRLRPGDILLNEGQSLDLVGRSAMYEGVPHDCAFQNTLVRFRPLTTVDPSFALLLFQHLQARGQFAAIASRTTSIAHLGVERFAALHVCLPPLSEQQRIAALLSKQTRAQQATNNLLVAKHRFKLGVLQQVLMGRARLSEFVTSPAQQSTPYGPVPADWQYLRIGDFAREINQRAGRVNEVPVLACTKHAGLVNSLSYFRRQVYSQNTSQYKVVRLGQFAFPSNHVEEGSIGLLKDHAMGLVSPIYTVFEVTGTVIPEYLYAVLKSDLYRHIFSAATNESVNRRGSLRWREFSQICVALPGMKEQEAIVTLLRALDKEITALKLLATALDRQKRALREKLLSGELRLPAT